MVIRFARYALRFHNRAWAFPQAQRSSSSPAFARHELAGEAVLKRSAPPLSKAYLVFFGEENGLREGRDIQPIDHVLFPDLFEMALDTLLS